MDPQTHPLAPSLWNAFVSIASANWLMSARTRSAMSASDLSAYTRASESVVDVYSHERKVHPNTQSTSSTVKSLGARDSCEALVAAVEVVECVRSEEPEQLQHVCVTPAEAVGGAEVHAMLTVHGSRRSCNEVSF